MPEDRAPAADPARSGPRRDAESTIAARRLAELVSLILPRTDAPISGARFAAVEADGLEPGRR